MRCEKRLLITNGREIRYKKLKSLLGRGNLPERSQHHAIYDKRRGKLETPITKFFLI